MTELEMIEAVVASTDLKDLKDGEVITYHELIVKDLTVFDLLLMNLFICCFLVLSFLYVRRINRGENKKPNFLHKLCCPLLSVLRWEGFDSEKSILAIWGGCLYTVFLWDTEKDGEELEDESEESILIYP